MNLSALREWQSEHDHVETPQIKDSYLYIYIPVKQATKHHAAPDFSKPSS